MKNLWFGKMDYEASLYLHEAQQEVIYGLEHTPTITLGSRARESQDVVASPLQLNHELIKVVQVERGGHATLHSPGQLIIYPLIHIRQRSIRVRDFVGLLEEATIRLLKTYGVELFRKHSDPGLYTKYGKMAFFGLRIREGRTSHGLAINISNDLKLFQCIRSCGHEYEEFDKLENYIKGITLEALFQEWTGHFLSLMPKEARTERGLTVPGIPPILAQS